MICFHLREEIRGHEESLNNSGYTHNEPVDPLTSLKLVLPVNPQSMHPLPQALQPISSPGEKALQTIPSAIRPTHQSPTHPSPPASPPTNILRTRRSTSDHSLCNTLLIPQNPPLQLPQRRTQIIHLPPRLQNHPLQLPPRPPSKCCGRIS